MKPFGLPMKKCQYETCTHHHYDKISHHRITRLVQGSSVLALMIFAGWRFYLVAHRYLNLPIPEENRNQITPYHEKNVTLKFWEYFQ